MTKKELKYAVVAPEERFVKHEKFMRKYIKGRALQAAKLRDLDAELNSGALIEVCRILGKPLYMRVDHRDPEMARHELLEMRAIVKDVVWPEDD